MKNKIHLSSSSFVSYQLSGLSAYVFKKKTSLLAVKEVWHQVLDLKPNLMSSELMRRKSLHRPVWNSKHIRAPGL